MKLHIDNFVSRPRFAGGCPLLNGTIDADDGNPALYRRAQKAFHGWVAFLNQIIEQGQKSEKLIPRRIRSPPPLIISLLEGAFFTSMQQKSKSPHKIAQQHLNRYLEDGVRKATP